MTGDRFLCDRAERLVPRYCRPALPRLRPEPVEGQAEKHESAHQVPLGAATAAPTLTPPGVGAAFPFKAPSQETAAATAPGTSQALPGAVVLPDPVLILLGSIALHDDLAIPALITELAVARAKAIGLGSLARAVLDHPEFERNAPTRYRSGGP